MALSLLTRIVRVVLTRIRSWRQLRRDVTVSPPPLETAAFLDGPDHDSPPLPPVWGEDPSPPHDTDPPFRDESIVIDATALSSDRPSQPQPLTPWHTPKQTSQARPEATPAREADAITRDQPTQEDAVTRQDLPNATTVAEQAQEEGGKGKSNASQVVVADRQPTASRRRAPSNVRGMRTPRKTTTRASSPPERTHPPELIAARKGAQWEVILSTPDQCRLETVVHNEKAVEIVGGEYTLPSFDGLLSVVYGEGRRRDVQLFTDDPMVFKLGADWKGRGRSLNGITHGHFIVIAPRKWTRIGNPPVEPEDCTDACFLAHYFYRSKDDPNDVAGFKECSLALRDVSADLVGGTVEDDARAGRLFGGEPPRLKDAPDIAFARVGEEGGKGWSGENFDPAERSLAKVLNGRQGHLYVRVYNQQIELQDSCEFRYLRDLKEIWINDEPYTSSTLLPPGTQGHESATVSFTPTTDDGSLTPIVQSVHAMVRGGRVVVDPCPEADGVRCTLESEGASVEISLHLPRIWWRVEDGAAEPTEWGDEPLDVTRRQFTERAKRGEIVRVRLPRRFRFVDVGFNSALDRRYSTKAADNPSYVHLLLPLADFVAYSPVAQRLNEDAVLSVDCEGVAVPVVRIAHDPLPRVDRFTCAPQMVEKGQRATLRWVTFSTEADVAIVPSIGPVPPSGSMEVAPKVDTTYTLCLTAPGLGPVTSTVNVTVFARQAKPKGGPVACVATRHGQFRRGKGFALGEVSAASLTMEEAKRLSIRIDKRRRSTHAVNVAMIRRLSNV